MIGTISYNCNRVLTGLDFKEKSIVKGVRLIETKLKRRNVSERIELIELKHSFLIMY